MAKRLLLRDAENVSGDMLQRILGMELFPTAAVAGVGTGYAAGVIGKLTGVATTGHLAVTADGADRILTILPGWAAVIRDAGGSSFDPRAFFAESDANDSTITLTANATGSTRNDTVCLRVDQNTAPTSDGSNLVSLVAIAGQAGGGLSNAPADGNLYLPLANVAVANGAPSVSNGNVTDLRTSVLATASPILLPPGFGGTYPPTSFGSLPIKLDEQSTANGASLTLTVPGGGIFRSLEIEFTGRSSAAASNVGMQFNADTAGNYDCGGVSYANATVAGATPSIAATSALVATISVSTAPAGSVGGFRITIQNADSATLRKTYEAFGMRFDSDAAAGFNYLSFAGQWRNTANPITSIKLLPTSAVNLINARAILWGRP